MSVLILGVESSCDETAAAVLQADGEKLLLRSNIVSSQIAIHARYGGVVPELASRAHLRNGIPVLEEALTTAGVTGKDIDAVAVTVGPGLVGALLVGLQMAKSLAYVWNCKLIGVNHLAGHLEAVFLEDQSPAGFPYIALLVSGGHTALYRVEDHLQMYQLGATRDDAAGEAFDKAAKMLGLPYPGGVQIDRLAKQGDRQAFNFPRAMHKTGLDFSFSGLKTACRIQISQLGAIPEGQLLSDLCASYQEAIVDSLWLKTERALAQEGCQRLVVSGGVAANSRLREAFAERATAANIEFYMPSRKFCTDNAAMIACAGYRRFQRSQYDNFDLNAQSRLSLR
jgi:N6-L-threonylcarbamoyladenine synthase